MEGRFKVGDVVRFRREQRSGEGSAGASYQMQYMGTQDGGTYHVLDLRHYPNAVACMLRHPSGKLVPVHPSGLELDVFQTAARGVLKDED